MEITWYYVKDENPKKKGVYLIATEGNNKSFFGEYEGGKWYAFGYETESGGRLEIAPYAWAERPDKPRKK